MLEHLIKNTEKFTFVNRLKHNNFQTSSNEQPQQSIGIDDVKQQPQSQPTSSSTSEPQQPKQQVVITKRKLSSSSTTNHHDGNHLIVHQVLVEDVDDDEDQCSCLEEPEDDEELDYSEEDTVITTTNEEEEDDSIDSIEDEDDDVRQLTNQSAINKRQSLVNISDDKIQIKNDRSLSTPVINTNNSVNFNHKRSSIIQRECRQNDPNLTTQTVEKKQNHQKTDVSGVCCPCGLKTNHHHHQRHYSNDSSSSSTSSTISNTSLSCPIVHQHHSKKSVHTHNSSPHHHQIMPSLIRKFKTNSTTSSENNFKKASKIIKKTSIIGQEIVENQSPTTNDSSIRIDIETNDDDSPINNNFGTASIIKDLVVEEEISVPEESLVTIGPEQSHHQCCCRQSSSSMATTPKTPDVDVLPSPKQQHSPFPILDLFDSTSINNLNCNNNFTTPIAPSTLLNKKIVPNNDYTKKECFKNIGTACASGPFRFNAGSTTSMIMNNPNYYEDNLHLIQTDSQSGSSGFHNNAAKKPPISTRISILGKPLPIRKEVSFYRERILMYNLLQRPKGFWAICYHVFVILVVVLGLILFALSTVEQYYQQAIGFLRMFDAFILVLLVTEFFARAWSSACISKYQGWSGQFRFLTSTFRLIDIFIILASGAVLWIHHADPSLNRMNVDWLRFAQAFQVLRVSHRFRPWRIMASVIWTQRDHLAIAVYMCSLSLIFITFTVYFIEHTQPDTDFTSIPKTLWWGIVSLLTIGYGDMVPTSTTGKVMASVLLLLCFSAFALPAGILGTGLALKVQEQQRQKHIYKRRDPAARLIQCAWRRYASSENSRSIATWKVCIKRMNNRNVNGVDDKPPTTPSAISDSNQKLSDQQVETGTLGSMVDLKLIRRIHRFVNESQASLVDNYGRSNSLETNGSKQPQPTKPEHRRLKRSSATITKNTLLDSEEPDCIYRYFTAQEKCMIRFIRNLKFEVARKNFKKAFRPYDINDVIEQYAVGHDDVVRRVKNMQSRITTIHNGLSNVMQVCQDLNYVHYHQIDRLERAIQELTQRLVIHQQMEQTTNGPLMLYCSTPSSSSIQNLNAATRHNRDFRRQAVNFETDNKTTQETQPLMMTEPQGFIYSSSPPSSNSSSSSPITNVSTTFDVQQKLDSKSTETNNCQTEQSNAQTRTVRRYSE